MRVIGEQRPVGLDIAYFLVSVILALFIQATGARLESSGSVFLNLPLIALFVWSIRRPGFVSPPVLLLVGFLQDLFSGAPLGVWAIAYIASFSLARDREADGSGGEVGPLAVRFAVLAVIAFVLAWLAGSAAIGAPAHYQTLIGEGLVTILLFPLFAWAFARKRERSSFF